jgi:hypothetical protein
MSDHETGGSTWAGVAVAGLGLIGTIWRLVYSRRPRQRFKPDPKQTWAQALALIDRQQARISELEKEVSDLRRVLRITALPSPPP